MAERLERIGDAPPFNASAYSDRLQETRQAAGPLPAVPVFDKTKPDSITPWKTWVSDKLKDKVNALVEFTADIEDRAVVTPQRVANHEVRLDAVEAQLAAQPRPFP